MSSSSDSTKSQSADTNGGCSKGKSGNWSCFNIAAMVVGFILFWPLGLFILFWNMSGRSVKELPNCVRRAWGRMTGFWGGDAESYETERSVDASDNAVFNEYQETQHDRIREIKDEIKERSQRFRNFRDDAKRRADKEEFENFMSNSPGTADQ